MTLPEKKENNRLFGTDGIRAAFGEYPLDRESVRKLGNALGRLLHGSKIVMGRDTRQSGEEIVRLLASGMADMSNETELYDCGVIPTPGLSYITDQKDYDYGIMITASHNPWTDNGIKIFKGDGEKIPETLERQLEEFFFAAGDPNTVEPAAVRMKHETGAAYRDILFDAAGGLAASRKTRFKVILDCANGAAFETAPAVFAVLRRGGIDVDVMGNQPDGKNINFQCGSTHLDELTRRVKAEGADLGIAFDGDADRVLMVDGEGHTLDGDHALYLIAKYLLETDDNFNKVVVGTVMGNLGLEKALNEMGVTYVRTKVGDKYVYEEMKNRGAVLGGEQSGHTILRAFRRSGDGMLTALYFLRALFYFKLGPGDVFRGLRLYPQEMKSITVREKPPLESWDALNQKIGAFNAAHGADSRILIRYSGTEPKIRVMIESRDEAVIRENIGKFEAFIKTEIGKDL